VTSGGPRGLDCLHAGQDREPAVCGCAASRGSGSIEGQVRECRQEYQHTTGLNIISTGAANTIGSATTEQYSAPGFSPLQSTTALATTISDALNLFFFRSDLNLGATIKALEVKGLLQILAEPNVLAQNGKKASFLAGGEFPFPTVSSGTGGTPMVTIQFREFGVRLTFTPTITPRGTIHLEVAPEVSALDFTNGLSVSGFIVPALTTRKLDTQVELREGQSFAIGGLLDNRTTNTLEKMPFIGDIPILESSSSPNPSPSKTRN